MLSKTLDLMENLFTDDPCKQVYEIFDHAVLENYPEFKKYLAINAQIVHDKLFELLAVMKVMKGEELNANESNKQSCKLRKTRTCCTYQCYE